MTKTFENASEHMMWHKQPDPNLTNHQGYPIDLSSDFSKFKMKGKRKNEQGEEAKSSPSNFPASNV